MSDGINAGTGGSDRGQGGNPEGTAGGDGDWYYDLRTGQVGRGLIGTWDSRLGPYPTREAAEAALETARARTEAADEADRQWGDDDDDDWGHPSR